VLRNIILSFILINSLALADAKEFVLKADSTFVIDTEFAAPLANNVLTFLSDAHNTKKTEVVFVLNSPGGEIFEGGRVINFLDNSKVKTTAVVSGLCASMCAITLQHFNERYMTKGSVVMYHKARGGVEGDIPTMKSRMDAITNFLLDMDNYVAKRLKIGLHEYFDKIKSEYWITNPEQGIKENVIDGEATIILEKSATAIAPALITPDITPDTQIIHQNTNELNNFLKSFR
jgi:ATP-dependent protease ClpP protease subunit